MTTQYYQWDSIEDSVCRELDSLGHVTCDFLSELALHGSPISEIRSGPVAFYHVDGSGSTVALTNSEATVTDTFQYDSSGSVTVHTGQSVTAVRFEAFRGYRYDSLMDEYYCPLNWLSTATYRWLSRASAPGYAFVSLSQFTSYTLNPYLVLDAPAPTAKAPPGTTLPFAPRPAQIIPDYPPDPPTEWNIEVWQQLSHDNKKYINAGSGKVPCGTFTAFARRDPKLSTSFNMQIQFSQPCKPADPRLPANCCCDEIQFIQAAKGKIGGSVHIPNGAKPVASGPYKGWIIDRNYGTSNSPYHNYRPGTPGQIGASTSDGTTCKHAYMNDNGGFTVGPSVAADFYVEAVSCAVCAQGPNAGTFFGCISWKMHMEYRGMFSPFRFWVHIGDVVTTPPPEFMQALAALKAGYPDEYPNELP